VTEEGFLNLPRRIGRRLLCFRTGYLPLVLVAAFLHVSVIGLAAAPPASSLALAPATRGPSDPKGAGDEAPALSVPPGSQLCPFSGPGAACDVSAPAAASPGLPPVSPSVPAKSLSLTNPLSGSGDTSSPRSGPSGLGVTIKTDVPAAVGVGKPLKLTASASVDVSAIGRALVFWDATTGKTLTFCSTGTTCSTMLSEPAGGAHDITAYIARLGSSAPASIADAASNTVSPTWLSVLLAANTTLAQEGGTVNLTAVTNADLTDTPWSLGILDQNGRLLDQPCKSGRVCNAQVTLGAGPTPFFSAVIGAAPAPSDASTTAGQLLHSVIERAPLVNVQVRSAAVQPNRLLWGVDSCKAFTGDAAASSGLYPQVNSILGRPDFWGRYLTNTPNCPGISDAEVAAAANRHMGILPIFNHYDCSAVAGYDTGTSYASEATSAAVRLGIPRGTVLVIDVEPPGPWCSGAIDGPFVEGWYDGVSEAGYSPGYYGDGTAPSTFGQAWCAAVDDRPEVATRSYLWSFEPSLLGSYTKARSPQWMPNQVGCAGNMVAWQYELSSGANPDVDHDQALAKLPLWFP